MFLTLKWLSTTGTPMEIGYFIQFTICSIQADRKEGKRKTKGYSCACENIVC
jgi:hypothetical protein